MQHMIFPATRPGRFAWFSKRWCRDTASTRLRVLLPMEALDRAELSVERYSTARIADYSAIVISKSFGRAAMRVAAAARAAGVPIIVDICDNVLDRAQRHGRTDRIAAIRAQLAQAALITVPTPVLGELLTGGDARLTAKIRVVPDMLECLRPCSASAGERYHLWRLRRFLAAHPDRLHCVWFGRTSDASGLIHLDAALADQRLAGRRDDITVTVISNDAGCFRRASRDWEVPHHFMPWQLGSFGEALRSHRVALIPVDRNAYTVGKTLNRPATAILAGLGVVADGIDSYRELAPYVHLDDWERGLGRYAADWSGEAARLARAKLHLQSRYGPDVVADAWRRVLHEAADVAAVHDARRSMRPLMAGALA